MDKYTEYTKLAEAELDKNMSALESMKNITNDDLSIFIANVQFAHRLKLINIDRVRMYQKRLDKLLYIRRTQTGIIDDAYENPLEREIRYSKEALKRDIAFEKELLDHPVAQKSETLNLGR